VLERGAGALSDAKLLSHPADERHAGQSAWIWARSILAHFGSLRHLLAVDRARLLRRDRFWLARYAEIQAAAEISRRQLSEPLRVGPLLEARKPRAIYLSARAAPLGA